MFFIKNLVKNDLRLENYGNNKISEMYFLPNQVAGSCCCFMFLSQKYEFCDSKIVPSVWAYAPWQQNVLKYLPIPFIYMDGMGYGKSPQVNHKNWRKNFSQTPRPCTETLCLSDFWSSNPAKGETYSSDTRLFENSLHLLQWKRHEPQVLPLKLLRKNVGSRCHALETKLVWANTS